MDVISVYNIFAEKVEGNKLKLSSSVHVDVHIFASLFKNAPNNPSYDDLIKINGEEDEMGYESFLNDCKKQGILN